MHLSHIQGHSKLGSMNARPAFLMVIVTMSMPCLLLDMSRRAWIAR